MIEPCSLDMRHWLLSKNGFVSSLFMHEYISAWTHRSSVRVCMSESLFAQCVYVNTLGTVHLFMKLNINVFAFNKLESCCTWNLQKKGTRHLLERKKNPVKTWHREREKILWMVEWVSALCFTFDAFQLGPFCNCEINWISADRFRSCAIWNSAIHPIRQNNKQEKLTHPGIGPNIFG